MNRRIYASIMIIAAVTAFHSYGFAQAKPQQPPAVKAAGAAKPESDKLDVSDLEKKYWAAKDTDFSVVQNRTYSKAGRFGLSAAYGTTLNDTWSDGPTYGGILNYYFTDRYGVQIDYTNTQSKDSQATSRLAQTQGGFPNHNKLKQYYGASFNWVPIYAKMSLLNSSIIYFDMAISPGLGVTEYEQQMDIGNARVTAPTASLDISQHFFLNQHLALRVDLKNRWFQEDIMQYRLPVGTSPSSSRKLSSDINYSTILLFGVTVYF